MRSAVLVFAFMFTAMGCFSAETATEVVLYTWLAKPELHTVEAAQVLLRDIHSTFEDSFGNMSFDQFNTKVSKAGWGRVGDVPVTPGYVWFRIPSKIALRGVESPHELRARAFVGKVGNVQGVEPALYFELDGKTLEETRADFGQKAALGRLFRVPAFQSIIDKALGVSSVTIIYNRFYYTQNPIRAAGFSIETDLVVRRGDNTGTDTIHVDVISGLEFCGPPPVPAEFSGVNTLIPPPDAWAWEPVIEVSGERVFAIRPYSP